MQLQIYSKFKHQSCNCLLYFINLIILFSLFAVDNAKVTSALTEALKKDDSPQR